MPSLPFSSKIIKKGRKPLQVIKKDCKTILVSAIKNGTPESLKNSLAEMTDLALAAGLKPIDRIKQNLRAIDPAFLIGEGKRTELQNKVGELKPEYVIFDHILSGVQTRNLEKQLNLPVLDRNQLILEIFAGRARSHEGKLQVQLAQLLDQMPRMTGAWLGSLSRQGGRMGAKGPGEKALEVDRRRAREKVRHIRAQLKKVSSARRQRRIRRKKMQVPSFALIGYTNSGKSALLNHLTNSQVETKNQPFMTLDPTTRKVFIPGIPQAVMTDTVGFIRHLPHHLIEAFKATLEEAAQADILLHVIDRSDPFIKRNISVVNDLIEELGWQDKPILYVFNKSDLTPSEGNLTLSPEYQPGIITSAKTGEGINSLLHQMKSIVGNLKQRTELYFPKEKEQEIYNLSREAEIQKTETGKFGSVCLTQMTASQRAKWKSRIISKE